MEKSKNNILKIVAIILAVAIVVVGVAVGLKFKDKFTSGFSAEVTTTEETIEEPTTEEQTTEEQTTEEPTTAFDTSVYDGILDEYRKTKKAYDEGTYGEDYNQSLCNDICVLHTDIFYAYSDVIGDSDKELIVATAGDDDVPGPTIISIWKFESGEVKPIFEDRSFGYRNNLVLCENNFLYIWQHCSAFSSFHSFYRLDSDSLKPVFVEGLYDDTYFFNVDTNEYDYKWFRYHVDTYSDTPDENRTEITKEEFDSIMAKYVPVTDFDWQPLN